MTTPESKIRVFHMDVIYDFHAFRTRRVDASGLSVVTAVKLLAEQLIETVDVTLSYVCLCCCLFCPDHL